MQFTALQIAGMLNGSVEGDPQAIVTGLSKIEEGEVGTLSFLSNPLYTPYIYGTKASIVIVNNTFTPERPVSATLIRVEAADIAFSKLLEFYNQIKNDRKGISKLSAIAESAVIGESVYAGEFVVIGENVTIGNNVKLYPHVFIDNNTTIGDNTVLFAGVKIYSDNKIGRNCIIHAGTVIGSDGFRFNQQDGLNIKVPQIGNVIIEDDVEMGSNCTIDRATFGSTIIRKGVKFDNQIHVAHNVEVGENTCIAAGTGIAGSTKVGKNCMISGHVSMTGHITIADGTILGGATGVSKSLTKPGEMYLGVPALEVSKYRRSTAIFRNLPELAKRVDKLEKERKQI
ncbi:MAG: UDP-3-O-(3-hydroxymyristoyl)glucosamine N-acyltransferase [Bacteroidetes bacterium]|nr:UDP-3-O-(3-hydroxymyristoyl)glucosamine N-acyltransferase [Bacteroidota bacterium]